MIYKVSVIFWVAAQLLDSEEEILSVSYDLWTVIIMERKHNGAYGHVW
jgi:hypothetical protein